MNTYICPACGSSVDAGEHCSCGARDKPVLRKYADGIKARNNKNGTNAHNAYITTQSGLTARTVIYDEFYSLEQQLIKGKQQREAKQKQHRKGIYETICRKTEKSQ